MFAARSSVNLMFPLYYVHSKSVIPEFPENRDFKTNMATTSFELVILWTQIEVMIVDYKFT